MSEEKKKVKKSSMCQCGNAPQVEDVDMCPIHLYPDYILHSYYYPTIG